MTLLENVNRAINLVDKFCIPIKTQASGKVLLTGGYLIIFPKYRGISIALDCHFHATLTYFPQPHRIKIICPQWLQATLFYSVHRDARIEAEPQQLKNPFIESSLQCFMQFLLEIDPAQLALFDTHGLQITLVGDDAFYNKSKDSEKERKMGLGSSAALTVSLIKCLFSCFNLEQHAKTSAHDLHNLCQLTHFVSQGKIGSGFDIATALFGSILFRRYTLRIDKAEFQHKLDALSQPAIAAHVSQSVVEVLQCMQMSELQPMKMPPHLCIVMGVPMNAFGSKTPKMVAKILQWRQENSAQCETLWTQLDAANESVVSVLQRLQMEYETRGENAYVESMRKFVHGNVSSSMDVIHQQLQSLQRSLKQIREYQKQMSAWSTTTVVPAIMDNILNECANIGCVVEGGVPGAGGFDAIYVLCIGEKAQVMQTLQAKWSALNMQILNV